MIVSKTRAYLRHLPIITEMCYDPRKPAEVLFTFDRVEWIFSRDLLARGMTERSGEGDVVIRPSGVRHLEIYLESPTGECNLSMVRSEVSDFLEKTLNAVPDDEEEERISVEIDLWLKKVFRVSD